MKNKEEILLDMAKQITDNLQDVYITELLRHINETDDRYEMISVNGDNVRCYNMTYNVILALLKNTDMAIFAVKSSCYYVRNKLVENQQFTIDRLRLDNKTIRRIQIT